MNFLKKIFGSKKSKIFGFQKSEVEEEPEKREVEINFSELDSWLDNETKPFLEEINTQITESNGKIEEIKNEMQENIGILKNKDINEEIVTGVKKGILDNRVGLTGKLQAFIVSNRIPDDLDYNNASKFYRASLNDLMRVMAISAKYFYIIGPAFEEDAEKLKTNLRELKDTFSNSLNFIESKKEKIVSVKNARKVINDIEEINRRIEGIKKELSETSAELENLEKEDKSIKEESKTLQKSDERALLEKLNYEKEKNEGKLNETEDIITQTISPLKKALVKYERFSTPEENRLVNLYITEPKKAVVLDENTKVLNSMLQNLEFYISKGTIELKDKVKNKTLNQIKQLDKEKLKDLIKNYSELKNKETALNEQISKIDVNEWIEKLERKFDGNQNKKRELNIRQSELKNNAYTLKEKINSEQNNLEKTLENIAECEVKLKNNIEPFISGSSN